MKQSPILTTSRGRREPREAARFGFQVKIPKNIYPFMHQNWSHDTGKRKEIRPTQLRGGHHPKTGCCCGRRDDTHHANSYHLLSTYFGLGALSAQTSL